MKRTPQHIKTIIEKLMSSIECTEREKKILNIYIDRIIGKGWRPAKIEPATLEPATLELIKELRKTETDETMIGIMDYELRRSDEK